MEIQQNAVAQDRDVQLAHVFEADVIAAFHQRAGFGGQHQELRRAHAAAVVDVFLHDVRRGGILHARGAHQFDGVLRHRFGDGRHADQLLEVENLFGGGDRVGLGDVRGGGQIDDLQFLLGRQIIEQMLNRKRSSCASGSG